MSKTKEERGSNWGLVRKALTDWDSAQEVLKWIFARPWVVAILILGAVLLIWGLTCLCNKFNICGKENELIRYLGWTLAGILSAWGLWVANRRAKAMEKSAEAQAEAVKAQADAVRATEAGHRQQRFRDAVAHLGDEQPSVRMGGVHALFHLACEEDDLRASIADILCSHIRATTGEEQYKQKYEDKPSTEVQSIMELLFKTTLARTEEKLDKFWRDLTPDLSEAWLRGLILTKGRLRGAYLEETQFQGAVLREAQLQGANLSDAKLQGAYLRGAQFQGANLGEAQLQGAYLREAQLQGAYLGEAQLQGANLNQAQLQGAYLLETQFQGAYLRGAQLQGVHLLDTKFQGAQSKSNDETSRWWGRDISFAKRIREFIDKPGDLDEVVLYGGLSDEDVENIMNSIDAYVPADEKKEIEKRLKTHVGERQPDKEEAMIQDMEQRGALGQYGHEEAEKWIKEYYKALIANEEDD